MAAQPTTNSNVELSSLSRPAWVLNTDINPYKAEFQGVQITIPPMAQKIAKDFREGGNLFPYLTACKFRSDYKQPQSWTQKGEPIFGPKALQVVELSEDELTLIYKQSKTDLKKQEAADEKKVRRVLKKELDKTSNKIAVSEDPTEE